MLSMEGKRGVSVQPHIPGVIVSYENRSVPAVPAKKLISLLLRGPAHRVLGGFWHAFFLKKLVIPNSNSGVIITVEKQESK